MKRPRGRADTPAAIHPTASSRAVVWGLLLISLAFSSFARLRLRELPLERDEGEYAYAGQLILKGIPPYRLAYNMKLPGTYLAYAGLMALFGESAAGIHLGLLAVNLSTILLVFLLGRELFDSPVGASAAVVYSVSSESPTVYGMAAHATHFVVLFGVAGTWLLWRAILRGSARTLFAAGLMLGTALVMKQQGLFLPAFGVVAVVGHFGRIQPFSARRLLTALAIFMAGVVAPFSAVCLWLWLAGVFGTFWFWTFEYARQYVVELTLEQGAAMFWYQIRASAAANWPFWVAAVLGAVGLAFGGGLASAQPGLFMVPAETCAQCCSRIRKNSGVTRVHGLLSLRRNPPVEDCEASYGTMNNLGQRERNRFVYAFFIGSFLCVCPGLYFREHYFIVLLPAIALLAGAACGRAISLVGQSTTAVAADAHRRGHRSKGRNSNEPPRQMQRASRIAVVALLAAGLAAAIWPQRGFFFFWTPIEACRAVYGANPFVESAPIADYLSSHSNPDERVAVVGSEPQLYFLSQRTSATGFIYTYPLMEPQPFARRMQEDMAREIEAARPALVVLVNVPASWLAKPGSDRFIFEWVDRFVRADYEPVGLVDILSPEHTEYLWDEKATNARPRSPNHVWILRRKSES